MLGNDNKQCEWCEDFLYYSMMSSHISPFSPFLGVRHGGPINSHPCLFPKPVKAAFETPKSADATRRCKVSRVQQTVENTSKRRRITCHVVGPRLHILKISLINRWNDYIGTIVQRYVPRPNGFTVCTAGGYIPNLYSTLGPKYQPWVQNMAWGLPTAAREVQQNGDQNHHVKVWGVQFQQNGRVQNMPNQAWGWDTAALGPKYGMGSRSGTV